MIFFTLIFWSACGHFDKGNRSDGRFGALVRFTYAGQAESVCLSGDFNGWSTEAHYLTRHGKTWEIEIRIPRGTYAYGFLVDGEKWEIDPDARFYLEDSFGRKNSILIIE